MAKLQREKITVSATYYNFNERYEEAVSHLDDESIEVVSVNLLKSEHKDDSIHEEYLVFYREVPVLDDDFEEAVSPKYKALHPVFSLKEIKDGAVTSGHVVTVIANGMVIYDGLYHSVKSVRADIAYWERLSKNHQEDGSSSCPLQFEIRT